MAPPLIHLRALAGPLVLLALAFAPLAAAQDSPPIRALYRGEGAAAGWLFELRLDSDVATATLASMLPAASTEAGASTSFEFEGARSGAELSLRGADATFEAQAAPDADVVPAAFDARWRTGTADGEGRFALLAEVAELRYRQGTIEITTTLPRVTDPTWEGVDARLASAYLDRHGAAIAEAYELRNEIGVRWGYWIETTVELSYVDAELLAFAESVGSYTGGAHGNLTFGSATFVRAERGPEPLPLAGLFAAGSDALPAVAAYVATELRTQGAAWLEEPTSVLEPDALADWVLTPAGIAFRFEPYAVGPYAQGPFEVIVDYQVLAELATPSGVMTRLLERRAAAR